MGGLVFAFFARDLLLAAEDDRRHAQRAARARSTSGGSFVFFNLTFFPLFAAGFLDQPRRVSTYAPSLQTLNDFVSASAFVTRRVDAHLRRQPDLLARLRAQPRQPRTRGTSRGLEWQVPTPVPLAQLRPDPGDHRQPVRLRRRGRAAGRAARRPRRRQALSMSANPSSPRSPSSRPRSRRASSRSARICAAAATAFFFVAFLFAFFYLRALDNNGLWGGGKPGHHVHPALTAGIVILVCVLASVGARSRLGDAAPEQRRRGSRRLGCARARPRRGRRPVLAVHGARLRTGRRRLRERLSRLDRLLHDLRARRAALARGDARVGEALGGSAARGNVAADVEASSLVWTMLGLVEIVAFVLLFIVQ